LGLLHAKGPGVKSALEFSEPDGTLPGQAAMRVLVIEDEEDLRESLVQSLREAGYAVDAVADGEEGLHFAQGVDYDAILLDVMLPRLDGWEVLRRLREKKETPVLMLTARRALDDRVRGLDLGADDYLAKPFDLLEAQARLRAILRRSKGRASSQLNLDGVVLDTARREALVGGVSVDLTQREYALIEYLAFRRGEVVTRTELYDHLFAEEDDSFSNLLDVHVCNVRRKLGKDFIQTRRGHGYVLA
jgi:two-component system OmpR family response regulator